ncbi:iron complex outermembrane recepter protein [Methylomagnum ishizawai]|uniref:Iron complex outermembrane recepter protein n=2 Tax=Methylomagnum ishizawai TaxID=1760988 RepID=A0A1Y6D3C6_9GAMM|nr:iron complex outermembrane recepter protein [Methylomagnum ishizawai]
MPSDPVHEFLEDDMKRRWRDNGADRAGAAAIRAMVLMLGGVVAGRTEAETPESGPDGTVSLEAVTVTGETTESTETAWGPVRGYVAKRSASGSKTDTPLIETPQTINVVARDEIAARAAQNLSQATAYTPGLLTEMFGPSTRDDYFNLRGFDVPQYLNGLRLLGIGYANIRTEPYGLERVEILRGPSSVLYGQNPPGGLVNLVSKRPTLEPLHQVELLGGSFGRVQGAVDLGGPLDDSGQFLYRLTALGRGSDTQVDHAKDDRYFVAPSFTWRPDADTSFTLLTHYQKDEAGNSMQFLPPQGSLQPNPNGRIPTSRFLGEPDYDRFDREQYTVGYAFEHRFNSIFQVRQNLRYAHVETDYPVIFVDGFVTGANGLPVDYRTVTRSAGLYQARAGVFTLDTQAQADFDTGPVRHTVLFGADYRNLGGDNNSGIGSAPNIDMYSPVYGQPFDRPPIDLKRHQDLDQFGLYLQDQIKYERFGLTLSGRHDWAESFTHENDLLYSTLTDTRQDDSAFTYRIGLNYLFDSGFAPYASYSDSFEPVPGTDFSGTPFQPTTGQQWEVGIKYQPPGYNAFLTLSAFHLTQQNIVTADPDPAHQGYSIQTGEARVMGIELEGKASLAEGLDLTAGYSIYDSETTKTTEANQLGKRLPYTPGQQASTWLDYTVPVGPAAGFGLGGGFRYVGSNYGDLTNSLRAPSYTLIDAVVHYDLGKLDGSLKGARLAVNLSNLFDREYVATCGDGFCYYGNRRSVLASLRYDF